MSNEPKLTEGWVAIEVVSGVGGPCLAINGTRVAGPKPYGGGRVTFAINVTKSRILEALQCSDPDEEQARLILKAENARLRAALEFYAEVVGAAHKREFEWGELLSGERARHILFTVDRGATAREALDGTK
jgi:hypothetical protein